MNISSSKKPQIPNYTGPEKTGSFPNEKASKWLKPLNNKLVGALMRKEAKGTENIPKDGAHILCFQHESMTDAFLVQSLSDGDYRFLAAKEQFTGPIGKAMTAMGSIPVDRGGAGQRASIGAMTEVLDSGAGIAIAPEGRIRSNGKLDNFKEGPAMVALRSKAESMVPVVLDYEPYQAGIMNKVGTYLTTGAVVAGGLAATMFGGTVGQAITGAVTGAITGAIAGGAVGSRFSEHKSMRHKVEDTGLTGMGVGALLGAAAGGFGAAALGDSALWLTGATTAVSGLATLGISKAINERKHARVIVGEPIKVAPYREIENSKEARKKLTEDLKASMENLHTGFAEMRTDSK